MTDKIGSESDRDSGNGAHSSDATAFAVTRRTALKGAAAAFATAPLLSAASCADDDLADHVVAVNADIGEVEVALLDIPDPLANSVGLKGLGELVMVGASAAIANAVSHATGRRVRSLPIRIEDLL